MVLDSSTVITPSLPTFSIASLMSEPMFSSPAEMEATCAIACLFSTGLEISLRPATASATAASMPRLMPIGFAPAATFFMPSWMIACASRVAVVVPSPATSLVLVATSLTSCAPMFSNGSSSSISFAMVTPSFVMRGAPYFLSSTTLRPLGPRVILTVSASAFMPVSRERRASSPYFNCFAMMNSSCFYDALFILQLRGCRFGERWCILRRPASLPCPHTWNRLPCRRA